MPPKDDDSRTLENGHWEEVKQDPPLAKPTDSILGQELWNGTQKANWRNTTPIRTSKWFVSLIRPEFMARTGGPRKPLRSTAYLDGLRGFAALLVYWGHHQLWAREQLEGGPDKIYQNAFGYAHQYYFACLPFVRTFFSGGHYSVTVFFVMSGYVLSTKPLSLIRSGELIKLGDNLASALFRRWLRLYIPVIITTFCFMSLWHVFGIWTDGEHKGSYSDEILSWYYEFKNFSFVFKEGGEPWLSYNFHVWSIPVEMRGSVVIYTALMAFSRCTRNARLWCELGLMYYFMYIVDGAFCAMFMAGMLLCDLDMLAAHNELPRFFAIFEPYKDLIFYNLLGFSLYLGGCPSNDANPQTLRDSRGWYYLSKLKPQAVFDQKWFFLFWASTFLVASIPRIPWLKRFFELPFNLYLGRISFSFYLVHGPVMWTLGERFYAATGWARPEDHNHIPGWVDIFPISKSGPLGMDLAFLLPHLILLPFTLWVAEIVTKLLDEPSVRFAQWFYRRTLGAPSK